jgi:hypothetical protein
MEKVYFLSIVYLTTLSVSQTFLASNERMIVNNELKRMWKEAVVAYPNGHPLEGLRKTTKNSE